jgi:Tol biopolymer transport system component
VIRAGTTGRVIGPSALGPVTLVSSASDGTPANGQSDLPVLSPDGTMVAFIASAANLGVPPGDHGLFVKDLASGQARMLAHANTFLTAVWSPDSSRVAFTASTTPGHEYPVGAFVADVASGAVTQPDVGVSGSSDGAAAIGWSPDGTRLAVHVLNATSVIRVVNPTTGALTDVSTASDGSPLTGGCYDASWRPDGAAIAIACRLPGQPDLGEVYVKDLSTGALTIASSGSDGTAANGVAEFPWSLVGAYGGAAWSPDGTRLMFNSNATNLLVPASSANHAGLYVKNLTTGALQLVTATSSGRPGDEWAGAAAWSPDGTQIAFTGNGGLVDTLYDWQAFVKTLSTGQLTLLNRRPDGAPGNAWCEPYAIPAWSPDGSQVMFQSESTDLVPGLINGVAQGQLYVANLSDGSLTDVTTSADGLPEDTATDEPMMGQWTPDGDHVVFVSGAQNLTPVGTDSQNVFLKTIISPAN